MNTANDRILALLWLLTIAIIYLFMAWFPPWLAIVLGCATNYAWIAWHMLCHAQAQEDPLQSVPVGPLS